MNTETTITENTEVPEKKTPKEKYIVEFPANHQNRKSRRKMRAVVRKILHSKLRNSRNLEIYRKVF